MSAEAQPAAVSVGRRGLGRCGGVVYQRLPVRPQRGAAVVIIPRAQSAKCRVQSSKQSNRLYTRIAPQQEQLLVPCALRCVVLHCVACGACHCISNPNPVTRRTDDHYSQLHDQSVRLAALL